MKTIAQVIAALFILAGSVFALQGMNILPGSFMTGQMLWLVIGIIMVIAGLAVLIFAGRHRGEGS